MKNLFACLALLLSFQGFSQWVQLDNPPFTRHHGIGFAMDGVGYMLTGGVPGLAATRRFHSYDVATDTWTKEDDYPGPNRGYGIGDTWDGKYYFGFGVDEDFNYLADLWVFNPENMGFQQLANCPGGGRSHPALATMNGIVYMGMGNDQNGNKNDWWAYDIASGSWSQKANIPNARHHPYMFTLGDKIYVGSGHRTDWHMYDAVTDSWTQIASLDDRVAGTQFNFEGKGYALSGVDVNHNILATGEFWQYDSDLDSWTELDPHPDVSRWAPSSFIIDNILYLVAGHRGFSPAIETAYSYDMSGFVSSVEELKEEGSLSISPNPAKDVVSLNLLNSESLNNAAYTIYNVSGSKIEQGLIEGNQVSVSNLIPGTYFLEVLQKDQLNRVRLIKQ